MAKTGNKSPCMTCKSRQVTADYNCHSDCGAYKDWASDFSAGREYDRQAKMALHKVYTASHIAALNQYDKRSGHTKMRYT